jgi:hypothetical protein
MIEFNTVSREFRSLIHRRRLLMTFLGSLFAASGLILHNVLRGKLPAELDSLRQYVFAFYAVMVMVPSMIIALRMARLHGGLVLNGILYARLMQEQDFAAKGDPAAAARHNFFGVSFLQFLLVNLFAAASATLLALALDANVVLSVLAGAGVFLVWLLLYFRFHHKAVAFAMQKIAADPCAPFDRKEWRAHVSTSLEDANTGLLSDIGFVGLIMFSMIEKLTSLGEITRANAGPAYEDVQTYGPWVYAILTLVTCVFGLFVYVRVRVAIGSFSLLLDPTDRPFQPLRLTDSLLGYMLMAFLFAVSLHLVLILLVPELREYPGVLLLIDAAAFGLAVLGEQLTLFIAGKRFYRDRPVQKMES